MNNQSRKKIEIMRWIAFLPAAIITFPGLLHLDYSSETFLPASYEDDKTYWLSAFLIACTIPQIVGVAIAPRLRVMAVFIIWIAFNLWSGDPTLKGSIRNLA